MNSASARASSVLPTPVGPRKTNEPIGRFGSCRPGARAPERVRDRLDRLRPGRRRARAAAPPCGSSFSASPSSSRVDRDARPARDDRGDVVLVDLLLHHRRRLGPLARARRAPPRARGARRSGSRRRAARSPCALGALGLHAQLVDLPRDLLDALERVLLPRPARGELVAARLRLGELALERLAHAPASPSPSPRARSRAGARGARPRRARPARSRSPCAAATRPRRRGRSPCRAGSGRRCSGRRAPPRRRAPRRGSRTPWCAS